MKLKVMDIKQALADWDGKSTEYLLNCYQTHIQEPKDLGQLVDLFRDNQYEVGSTWLLKHALENGTIPDSETHKRIFDSMEFLNDWEASLHFLQCLQFLAIPDQQERPLLSFLYQALKSKKTFVRTWAYDGFYRLCKQFPQHVPEVQTLFFEANQGERASVKARLRQIAKEDARFA